MCVDQRTSQGRHREHRHATVHRRRTVRRSFRYTIVGLVVVGAAAAMLESGPAVSALRTPAILGAFDGGRARADGAAALVDRRPGGNRTSRSDSRGVTIAVSQQPGQDLWQLPVRARYTITSGFGARWGSLHPGTDLAVPPGTPVYAANAGTVIVCHHNGGYGNNVMIEHADGVVSVYGHGSTLLCREGQQVRAGELIMLSGNTGFSTGPHLHFELRHSDTPFDALPYMREHGVDLPTHAEVVRGDIMPSD
jgi:murein DD-endopeptidase MepM/ murein hydrolase activator NlpD